MQSPNEIEPEAMVRHLQPSCQSTKIISKKCNDSKLGFKIFVKIEDLRFQGKSNGKVS